MLTLASCDHYSEQLTTSNDIPVIALFQGRHGFNTTTSSWLPRHGVGKKSELRATRLWSARGGEPLA